MVVNKDVVNLTEDHRGHRVVSALSFLSCVIYAVKWPFVKFWISIHLVHTRGFRMATVQSDVDFEQIEEYLDRFQGGDVVLSTKYFYRGLAIIYLNNPGKKNAISGKMMVQLRQCVIKLEQWKEGKAVLLCGLGGNFSSGGDLDFAEATGTQEEALWISTWMQDTLQRLKNLPIFSVCLIQGPTLGGAAEISVFCDFILAADDVKYGFVQGKMGIITAWGGGTQLVRKIGSKKALNLFLTSIIMTAEECVENDIVDHIVPTQSAVADTLVWIDERLKHHYSLVRAFKKVVSTAASENFQKSLDYEKNLFTVTWGGHLNKEALAKRTKHVNLNHRKF